tara:strand:- start:1 stop:771 length:771 start_codon:yes stop_codon:yes gene_type:complete
MINLFNSNKEQEDNLYYYSLDKIQNDNLLIYHHLGLGDAIICNGFVNHISKKFKSIYLIVDQKMETSIKYLYSTNNKIKLLPVQLSNTNDADEEVIKKGQELNLKPLKIGFSYFPGMRFYKAFYKQLKLPYRYSYSLFNQPRDSYKEDKLYNHLIDYYEIKEGRYNIVHSQASNKTYDLKISNNLPTIFVDKESDIFGNMFYYNKTIENASEVHCLNSSFCHFVDRIQSKNNLYYHDIRGSKLQLKRNWKVINYGN